MPLDAAKRRQEFARRPDGTKRDARQLKQAAVATHATHASSEVQHRIKSYQELFATAYEISRSFLNGLATEQQNVATDASLAADENTDEEKEEQNPIVEEKPQLLKRQTALSASVDEEDQKSFPGQREEKPKKSNRNKVNLEAVTSVQCWGISQKKRPCRNKVAIDVRVQAYYCHYHVSQDQTKITKEVKLQLKSSTTFTDYLPQYLLPETRTIIEKEMKKPVSSADEPGYIYVFEISYEEGVLTLKVGRSIDPKRRLQEWKRRCSEAQAAVLKICCPEYKQDEEKVLCLSSHRVERLVLLELRDLALSMKDSTTTRQSDKDETRPSKKKTLKGTTQICTGCQQCHREIFVFHNVCNNSKARAGVGKEDVIAQVGLIIAKWYEFVEHAQAPSI